MGSWIGNYQALPLKNICIIEYTMSWYLETFTKHRVFFGDYTIDVLRIWFQFIPATLFARCDKKRGRRTRKGDEDKKRGRSSFSSSIDHRNLMGRSSILRIELRPLFVSYCELSCVPFLFPSLFVSKAKLGKKPPSAHRVAEQNLTAQPLRPP